MSRDLFDTIAEKLSHPRELAPQTERQLAANPRLEEVPLDALLADPDGHLEDYEVETLFGPLFPVSLADRASLSPLLRREPVDEAARAALLQSLVAARLRTPVGFPDGSVRELAVTEPVVDRFLRLHRVDTPLLPEVAEQLASLDPELAAAADALARDRALNLAPRQRLFARVVTFAAGRRALSVEDLQTIADFLAAQNRLETEALLKAIEQAVNLTREALDQAKAGRAYVSQAVAEHHGGHGYGEVDPVLVASREGAWTRLTALQEDLQRWAEA